MAVEKLSLYSLILKCAIFFLSIAISVASLYLIGKNVYSYVRAKKLKEELIATKLKQEKAEQDAALKAEQQRREMAQKETRRSLMLQNLSAKAKELADENRLQEAVDTLRLYHGEFDHETENTRYELSEKYVIQIQKNFKSKQKQVLSELAKLLLKREFVKAAEVANQNRIYLQSDTLSTLEDLCNVNRKIAETFKDDAGGLLMITLSTGGLVSAKLLRIEGEVLVMEQNAAEIKVPVRDIAILEREKRFQSSDSTLRALYFGIEYWQQKDLPMVSKHFTSVQPELQWPLQLQTGTSKEQTVEREAEIKLYQLLKKNQLVHDEMNLKQVQKSLSERNVSHSVNRQLKMDFDQFIRSFRQTTFFSEQAAIVNTMNNYLDLNVDFLAYSDGVGNIKVPEWTLPLSETPPEAFWDIPPTQEKSYYGKLKFGQNNSMNIVFQPGKIPKVILSYDDDTDFIGKNSIAISDWTRIKLQVKYQGKNGQEYSEPFSIAIRAKGNEFFYKAAGKRAGEILFGNTPYWVEIVDTKAIGSYTDRESLKCAIYKRKGTPSALQTVTLKERFMLGQNHYVLSSVSDDGRHLIFSSE